MAYFPNGAPKAAGVPPMQTRIEGATAVRQQPPSAGAPPREALPPEQRAMFDRMTKPLTMARVGRALPGAPLIVGTWTYTPTTGAPACERFTRDGNMVLLVEMQASDGTYAVGSDGIAVTLPSGSQKFKRAGETLVTLRAAAAFGLGGALGGVSLALGASAISNYDSQLRELTDGGPLGTFLLGIVFVALGIPLATGTERFKCFRPAMILAA